MSVPKKSAMFYLDAQLHERFKTICAREGDKMSSKIEGWIRNYVTEHEPGNPQLRLDKMLQLKLERTCYCGKAATHEVWAKNGWHGFLCLDDLTRSRKTRLLERSKVL